MVNFSNRQYAIIYLICFVGIFGLIIIRMYSKNIKKYLDENWRNVRCYPVVLPVAGLSDKADGKNFFDKTIKNFNMCATSFLEKFLAIFTAPLIALLKGILKGISGIKETIDRFRSMASVLRNMFASLVENTAKRMQNSYGATVYLQEKLKILLKKQSAMFEILKHFLGTLPLLFYSFSHGPIPRFVNWLISYIVILIIFVIICVLCILGGPFVKMFMCPICALCFEENTLIDLEDGGTKPIKELKIGDKIKGAVVKGIIKATHNNWVLYKYKGITVSGDHLIYEDGYWSRINTREQAERVYSDCPVICLITSTNNLYVKGNKFRDFTECIDEDVNLTVNYAVAKKCNNGNYYVKTPEDIKHLYYWLFDGETKVKINGTIDTMSNIVNNNLSDENIFGGVKILDEEVQFYNFNGIIVSGNTLYYDNKSGLWERIFQSDSAQLIENKKPKVLYNLISYNNIIDVYDKDGNIIKFRDFVEHGDEELNTKIDDYVTNRLNLMKYQ